MRTAPITPVPCHWLTWLTLAALLLLAACSGGGSPGAEAPPPVAAIPQDARGHYCGMYLFEHDGPKGQVLVRGRSEPVWLSTIREVFAFTLMPDEPKAIAAIYVQDMGRRQPGGAFPADAWIDARRASYVIGSEGSSGPGVSDALPFGDAAVARAYQQRHGGRVVAFAEMPEDYVFGPAAGGSDPLPNGATP